MEIYKARNIHFKEHVAVGDWLVKVYTISKEDEFNHPSFYQQVLKKLPDWLQEKNSFDASNDRIAFLILHAGTEGIFSLLNWWVGKNMLHTNIYMTDPAQLTIFKKISGDGLAPCIWELEIINHERISWTNNVLKQPINPDYENYMRDTINTIF